MEFTTTESTRQKIEEVCRKYHVRKLSIFGSTLHGNARPDSDLDVLVEFEPGHVPGFFTFVELEEQLSSIFSRNVDLRTPQDLSKYFRENVVREALPVYGANRRQ